MLAPITFIFILLDFLRHRVNKINSYYLYFFNIITRKKEKSYNVLTGASYYLLGCLIVITFFSNIYICISSLLIMTISDSFAAIIGIKYGKTKLYKKKSLEGSTAFFITAVVIIILFLPSLPVISIFIISFSATLAELLVPHKINDNLIVPLVASFLSNMLV